MRAVNLLPEESKSYRTGIPGAIPVAGAAAALVAVGVVAVLAHVESGAVASKQARLNDLQQQLSRVQTPRSAGSAAGAALLTSRGARVAAVEAALKGRVPWDTVMRQVALVLPEDTWLDGLQLAPPADASAVATAAVPTAPASGVTITGYTASPASLARVLQRLSVVTSLTDVKLVTSQSVTFGKKIVFQFSIGANIATQGGAS